MAALTSEYSNTHTYHNKSSIRFFADHSGSLQVHIDTERLHIRSLTPSESDIGSYASLFGDPKVMEKFESGENLNKHSIERRIRHIWARRWAEKDPYSALAVFKKDTGEFLGHVMIGHSDHLGTAELTYIFNERYWNKGFAKEAASALLKEYAPATIEEGYRLKGERLQKIIASVRRDNLASIKILERLGMHRVQEEEQYGHQSLLFAIDLKELMQKV